MENLRKATEMNTSSALPQFFSAHILNRAFSIERLGMSDSQRGVLNSTMLNYLNKALTLDPNLLPALVDRAKVHFELKQFQQAIPDYDKILALDPKDSGAYNDRGLAKLQLGDTYEAISDLGKAIENKKRQLQKSSSYENRADAYEDAAMGTRYSRPHDCDFAPDWRDRTVEQHQAVPRSDPEYKTASDEAIARKLNQTFYPNMKYEDFSKGFLHDKPAWRSTMIPDIYVKRSDAYLQAGNWHRAAVEFRGLVFRHLQPDPRF
jgi:tetratricopeptide (TPR) repeat protein